MNAMQNVWANFSYKEKDRASEVDKIIASMKTTAVNRYNASVRLMMLGKMAFVSTTIFSLGLIFIPLMQLAGVHLKLSGDVLNAVQIFLATSLLVYSVVIGTARYELRGEQLNDCGDKIKELIRELRRKSARGGASEIAEIQGRYSAIIADFENHIRNDFRLTILRESDIFDVPFPARARLFIAYHASILFQASPAIILLLVEMILVADMFGVTSVFTPYLSGAHAD